MKIRGFRHGSRSGSKGRIVKRCPCGGLFVITMSDHYNIVSECDKGCGNMLEEHRMHGGISLFEMDKGRR